MCIDTAGSDDSHVFRFVLKGLYFVSACLGLRFKFGILLKRPKKKRILKKKRGNISLNFLLCLLDHAGEYVCFPLVCLYG